MCGITDDLTGCLVDRPGFGGTISKKKWWFSVSLLPHLRDPWTNFYNRPRGLGIKINSMAVPLSGSLWRQHWWALLKAREIAEGPQPPGAQASHVRSLGSGEGTFTQIQWPYKALYPIKCTVTATQAFIQIREWREGKGALCPFFLPKL